MNISIIVKSFIIEVGRSLFFIIRHPKKSIDELRGMEMRWKILVVWSFVATVLFGCCSYNTKQFAKEIKALQEPIFSEFLEIYSEGHSWEGISEKEKKELEKLRQEKVEECREAVNKKL